MPKQTYLMVNCKSCNIEFLKKPGEVKRTNDHYCSLNCFRKYKKDLSSIYPIKCMACKVMYRSSVESSKFCSRKCSANLNNTINKDTRSMNISRSLKESYKSNLDKFIGFRRNHGNISENSSFSSKGEKELMNLIKDKFPNYKWQSGGRWNIGQELYKSLDIFCKEIKLIIEYDGIYHFKDVYGNLELVQLKDKVMEEFFPKNGWKIIRINEETFKKDRHNSLELIYNMVANISYIEDVTKIYTIPERINIKAIDV